MDGQIGLEPTPDEFVAKMVEVFRGVWRVLRDDGVCFVNLGDSYAGSWGAQSRSTTVDDPSRQTQIDAAPKRTNTGSIPPGSGLKPKDLMGVPWSVAFALRADGWYLRDAIVWAKPSPMPGSQRDRCTSSYEFVFQLTKRARYFFDMEAIKEAAIHQGETRTTTAKSFAGQAAGKGIKPSGNAIPGSVVEINGRIPRNVWRIASEGFGEAHFATFPTELPRRCIKAATSENGCCPECGAPWERVVERTTLRELVAASGNERHGPKADSGWRSGVPSLSNNHKDMPQSGISTTLGWRPTCECGLICDVSPCRVLDPFGGAGTTAIAACQLGRDCTLIELNPEYVEMARRRIDKALKGELYRSDDVGDAPLFAERAP